VWHTYWSTDKKLVVKALVRIKAYMVADIVVTIPATDLRVL
jgi:hypothetical protein